MVKVIKTMYYCDCCSKPFDVETPGGYVISAGHDSGSEAEFHACGDPCYRTVIAMVRAQYPYFAVNKILPLTAALRDK